MYATLKAMHKRSRISLVIPAYNETSSLGDCLRAALSQSEPFYEIIVVDNNSLDGTAQLAAGVPGVTVLREARQGVVHARNRGFNAASGDIIARIDADTLLPPDWTQQLTAIFTDESVDAVTGKMHYYDMALPRLIDGIDLSFRRYFSKVLGRRMYLQGANMALRKSAWRLVRHETCQSRGLHEDLDLAVHAAEANCSIRFDERLQAGIAYRQGDSAFLAFCKYALSTPATYRRHGLKSCLYMYPVVGLAIACVGPLKLLHRGYNPATNRFSVEQLLSPNSRFRVNPASYID